MRLTDWLRVILLLLDIRFRSARPYIRIIADHRLNKELELQSLFGLHVTWCTQLYSLAETPETHTPPPAFGLLNEGAIGQPR